MQKKIRSNSENEANESLVIGWWINSSAGLTCLPAIHYSNRHQSEGSCVGAEGEEKRTILAGVKQIFATITLSLFAQFVVSGHRLAWLFLSFLVPQPVSGKSSPTLQPSHIHSSSLYRTRTGGGGNTSLLCQDVSEEYDNTYPCNCTQRKRVLCLIKLFFSGFVSRVSASSQKQKQRCRMSPQHVQYNVDITRDPGRWPRRTRNIRVWTMITHISRSRKWGKTRWSPHSRWRPSQRASGSCSSWPVGTQSWKKGNDH